MRQPFFVARVAVRGAGQSSAIRCQCKTMSWQESVSMKNFFPLKRASLAALALWVLVPLGAVANTTVTYSDGGKALFDIEVPDFWNIRTGGLRDLEGPDSEGIRDISRVFGMTPEAHDGVWVGMIAPHGVSTLEEARAYLQDIGPFLVEDPTVAAPTPRRINGLSASSLKGKGRRNGKAIDFTVLAIELPGNRVAIAVVVLEKGADMTPLGDINAMLSSIKPVAGGR